MAAYSRAEEERLVAALAAMPAEERAAVLEAMMSAEADDSCSSASSVSSLHDDDADAAAAAAVCAADDDDDADYEAMTRGAREFRLFEDEVQRSLHRDSDEEWAAYYGSQGRPWGLELWRLAEEHANADDERWFLELDNRQQDFLVRCEAAQVDAAKAAVRRGYDDAARLHSYLDRFEVQPRLVASFVERYSVLEANRDRLRDRRRWPALGEPGSADLVGERLYAMTRRTRPGDPAAACTLWSLGRLDIQAGVGAAAAFFAHQGDSLVGCVFVGFFDAAAVCGGVLRADSVDSEESFAANKHCFVRGCRGTVAFDDDVLDGGYDSEFPGEGGNSRRSVGRDTKGKLLKIVLGQGYEALESMHALGPATEGQPWTRASSGRASCFACERGHVWGRAYRVGAA
ncbi:hypothetical protein M885DRAFT_253120 [Pelagophyceae sp. CCMP2097]|nr:hypothetical protein M885DRAFT_253120 [Pelagophyceae sp. CCMP2097]